MLLIPDWSQTQPTKEDIRLHGGIPPPPQPVLPSEFVIQLYNPDQQIHVKWNAGSWTTAAHWYFEIPQQSFRLPSVSSLDRTQDDPTASETTPKLGFKWKKDGKLSKDYVCTLSEKSTNPDGTKKKNREPDITCAIFRNFKEITVYEPNLSRVEIEDPKGLEVVMILGAVIIREVFNTSLNDAFNISDVAAAGVSETSNLKPQLPQRNHRHSFAGFAASNANGAPALQRPAASSPPPTDPRTQWELDAEEARLKKQVLQEERQRRRDDAAEAERVKKMLRDEEKRAREKQKEIDRETERLRKIYGREEEQSLQQLKAKQAAVSSSAVPGRHDAQAPPYLQPATAYPPAPIQRPHTAAPAPYIASNLQPQALQSGQYLNAYSGGEPSHDGYGHHIVAPPSPASVADPKTAPKKSFWKLRGGGSDESNRLTKQKSTVF